MATGKDGCAPTELRKNEAPPSYKHIAPMWGEAKHNVLLRCTSKLNSTSDNWKMALTETHG